MKRVLFTAAVLSFLSCIAGSTVRQEQYAKQNVYTLENEKLIISVSPENGGRGIRFFLKDKKLELVPKNHFGFFGDHWSKHDWPSGLFHLPYQAKAIPGKGKASLKLWITVPAKGGGKGAADKAKSLKMATEPEFQGLIVQKTITITDGSDIVRVDMEIKNPTDKPRAFGYYSQHHFAFGKEYRWDMPSTDGITGPTFRVTQARRSGPNWVNQPTAGWMAYSPLNEKNSLVFEMDYNYLDRLYSSGQTAEWRMESTMAAPGKSFKTTYYVYPLNGFEQISSANNGIVAGVRTDKKGAAGKAVVDLISRFRKYNDLTLNVKVLDLASKKIVTEKTFKIKELSDKVSSFEVKYNTTQEVIFRGILTGKDLKQVFEYNYLDEQSEFDRRFNYAQIGQGAAALAGGKEMAYTMKQPIKVKVVEKPDFSKIPKFQAKENKILVLFGMFTDHLKIYETFRHEPNTKISWSNAHPTGMTTFPAEYQDLFSYRTVFMCNVNFKSIQFLATEMLGDYVREGGTLVITGGFYTYGHGEFEGSAFTKFVPFEGMAPFDLKWCGKGKSMIVKKKADDPLLAGVDFSSKPQIQWYHAVKLKKGAKVLAEADGKPVIVKYPYGKGTVIACTFAPFGEPERAFWYSDTWKAFMKNCSKNTK
ncbi:MAG: hypothetical protein E7040_01720 [Lentisphaerae bacterium]|nr:hypothetical protein [Lentisphaerota bacterium]